MDRYNIEEMILDMADMVHENRAMRQEIIRLRKVETEYYQSVADRVKASEEASYNMLKVALVSSSMAINKIEDAEQYANM